MMLLGDQPPLLPVSLSPIRLCFIGSGRFFEEGVCQALKDLIPLLPEGSWLGLVFWRGQQRKFLKWVLKVRCLSQRVCVWRIHSVNEATFLAWLQANRVNTVLVAGLGEKVQAATLTVNGISWLNAHPSLLPLYRGGNPYSAVVRDACNQTGVTVHEMTVNWDHGPILFQEQLPLNPLHETGGSVQQACAQVLRDRLLPRLFKSLSEQMLLPRTIPPLLPRTAPSAWGGTLQERDRLLLPQTQTAEAIERQLRALSPWATGLLPLGNWTDDAWLVVERADLKPRTRQDRIIPCAQSTQLYVSKFQILHP